MFIRSSRFLLYKLLSINFEIVKVLNQRESAFKNNFQRILSWFDRWEAATIRRNEDRGEETCNATRSSDRYVTGGEGEGRDVARERSMPDLAYLGGWAFLPLAHRQFLSRPPHCPAIRPAILFARQNAHDLRTVVQKYRSSPLRGIENYHVICALDSIFFIPYLSLAINNKIALTTRLPSSLPSSLRARVSWVSSFDSRDWFERIRVPVLDVYTPRFSDVVPWEAGREGRGGGGGGAWEEKKALIRERGNINIGGGRNAWSWKESDLWAGGEGRGNAGFPPPSFPPPQRHRPSPCLGYKVVACLQAQSLCRWSTDPRKHLARPKKDQSLELTTQPRSPFTEQQVYFFFIFFIPLFRHSFEFRFSKIMDNY